MKLRKNLNRKKKQPKQKKPDNLELHIIQGVLPKRRSRIIFPLIGPFGHGAGIVSWGVP